MSHTTAYITPRSPRSSWFPELVKYLELEITFITKDEVDNFGEVFPLRKKPAIVTAGGFKLTETLAIITYLVEVSSKPEFEGVTAEERALNLRWLSFFNTDVMQAFYLVNHANTEKARHDSMAKVLHLIGYVETCLQERSTKFLSSNVVLVSDIFIYHILIHIPTLTQFPLVNRYFEAVHLHPIISSKLGDNPK
jgi:glutathione S-transferase